MGTKLDFSILKSQPTQSLGKERERVGVGWSKVLSLVVVSLLSLGVLVGRIQCRFNPDLRSTGLKTNDSLFPKKVSSRYSQ